MKKIAITQRVIKNKDYHEIRDCLDVNWTLLFKKIGFLPILIPTFCNFKDYFDSIDIRGVILTGGNDLHSVNKDEVNMKRDEFEKSLLKYCIGKEIPVIGVCRGMQLIGEFFGGELKEIDNHTAVEHEILIEDEIRTVNSYHNYSLRELPEDFMLKAETKEGDIEAFEHKNHKVFGQMWHPEREKGFAKEDMEFIKEFFK